MRWCVNATSKEELSDKSRLLEAVSKGINPYNKVSFCLANQTANEVKLTRMMDHNVSEKGGEN